jgi:putative selenate reductase molybdopterin-binding subunit
LADTGAYGCHALTVTGNTGHKSIALYVGDGEYRQKPNIRFYADVVYTNTPPAGAYRGYGVPQGFWAVERHMDRIAHELNLDPIEFRLKNSIRPGELHPFSTAWSEGREPKPEIIHTVGLTDCVKLGKRLIDWENKYKNAEWQNVPGKPYLRKGIGVALVMQGTAIPYLDMGGASIKMNDDGSFNLLVGATDLGTGSDTVLAQMAGEILGAPIEDIIVYSSDTDFTPFDKGAYASSTTYISGTAVIKAAQIVAEKIKIRATRLLESESDIEKKYVASDLLLKDRKVIAPDGRYVTLEKVAYDSLHHSDQEQIMASASFMSKSSPPPFAAQFAEVTVDIQTGQITVDKLVMAVDSGVIINPSTASGQIEGGMIQALGYAVCEEMRYDEQGRSLERDFIDYHIFRANEVPQMETVFIETNEPTHPFGVKAVAEIPMDGVAPAVGNAVYNACGVNLCRIPMTPYRVWKAMKEQS